MSTAIALQLVGRHAESLAAYRELLDVTQPPMAWRVASNYLVALHYSAAMTAAQLTAEAVSLSARFGQPEAQAEELQRANASGPLRIGFVSPDLSDHPVGLLLLPLLLFLDRQRFTPILYATGGRADATASALRRFAQWHDMPPGDHDGLTARLRADRIDILVDLAGHTGGNSLPVFARRAAPLQVSWLGYFGTTGIAAMDCVLMDAWMAPVAHEHLFSEQVLRMPHSRWCYHPVGFAPDIAAPPCVKNGFVTFGSFNNTSKYGDEVFSAWARILAAVPGSRLVLKWLTFADPSYCEYVFDFFAARGISRERLDLRGRSFHRELLAQYADVDIALDPFPFTGGYTSCEVLWMGLPLVTMAGDKTVARQGLSLIGNLGLPEWAHAWVADNIDGYVQNAVKLAADQANLVTIRQNLRATMKASPLMDGQSFAKDFEDVLLARWRRQFSTGQSAT